MTSWNFSKQIIDPAVLYSDKVLGAFSGLVDPWLNRRYDRLLSEREHLVRAWQARYEMSKACVGEEELNRVRQALDATLTRQPRVRNAAQPPSPVIGPLEVPRTRSCTSPLAYFQWQRSSGEVSGLFHDGLLSSPDEFSTIVDTDSPRTISAFVNPGANAVTLTAVKTVGTTAWVQLGRPGTTTLNVQAFFNAKDTIFTSIFGGGEGRITLGAFVAAIINFGEIRAGELWVPELVEVPLGSPAEVVLADNSYESFVDFEDASQTLEFEFSGDAGGVYACSFFVEVFATTTGLCWSMVDFEGVVDPFDICQ